MIDVVSFKYRIYSISNCKQAGRKIYHPCGLSRTRRKKSVEPERFSNLVALKGSEDKDYAVQYSYYIKCHVKGTHSSSMYYDLLI